MLEKIKYQVSETIYETLCLMVDSLSEVYRFSGEHTRVSMPNSVKDHILSLISLIDEIFIDMPPEYDFIKLDMYMRAIVHDGGEILGELSVVETQVQGLGISSYDKKKFESIIFKYFFDKAYECVLRKAPADAFKTFVRNLRDITDFNNIDKFTSMVKSLDMTKSKLDVIPDVIDVKKFYDHIENDISYAGKLFKAIDLIDGNEYYLKHAVEPDKVPPEIHTKVRNYCIQVANSLKDAEKHKARDYADLTDKVCTRMSNNVDRYVSITRPLV